MYTANFQGCGQKYPHVFYYITGKLLFNGLGPATAPGRGAPPQTAPATAPYQGPPATAHLGLERFCFFCLVAGLCLLGSGSYICIYKYTWDWRDSVRHHLLEAASGTANALESRQKLLYTAPSGWWWLWPGI